MCRYLIIYLPILTIKHSYDVPMFLVVVEVEASCIRIPGRPRPGPGWCGVCSAQLSPAAPG